MDSISVADTVEAVKTKTKTKTKAFHSSRKNYSIPKEYKSQRPGLRLGGDKNAITDSSSVQPRSGGSICRGVRRLP